MKGLKLILIPVMFLLALAIASESVEGVTILKYITFDATNGTDTYIDDGAASTEHGTNVNIVAGKSGTPRTFYGLLNLTRALDFIPSDATIETCLLQVQAGDEQPGAPVEDIHAFAGITPWNESEKWDDYGAGTGGINQTDYNGTQNIFLDAFPANPAADTNFNWTLYLPWCKKLFAKTLGDEDEGLYLNHVLSVATEGDLAQFSSSDAVSAELRYRMIVNYTEAGTGTEPPAIDLINLTSGSLLQTIFNNSDEDIGKLGPNGFANSSDTTPSIFVLTNESATCAFQDHGIDMNFTDMTTDFSTTECSTTGGLNHVCTLPILNQTTGIQNFSIGCKDTNGNENLTSTSGNFTINITSDIISVNLFLDGVDADRKYEYRTWVNISANVSGCSDDVCEVEIDLDAPGFGFNFSSGKNKTHFIFNITVLRIVNTSSGPSSLTFSSSDGLNVTSNNLTLMQNVSINISSSGSTGNLNISYGTRSKHLRGDLQGIHLLENEFLETNVYKPAVNFTYLSAGSKFIQTNLTDIDFPINLTFDITGFALDGNNIFTHIEQFNSSDSVPFNDSLTFHSDAPLGYFDDFQSNVSGRWGFTVTAGSSCLFGTEPNNIVRFGYIGDTPNRNLTMNITKGIGHSPCTGVVNYNDAAADLRNSSRVEMSLLFKETLTGTAGATSQILFTDGTSSIDLFDNAEASITQNYTIIKVADDYKSWEVFKDGTSQGVKDLSSLDFDKQIKIEFSMSCVGGEFDGTCIQELTLVNIRWSGAWLNRSTNNGTYKPTGNITQCLENAPDDISKATIISTEFNPENTSIAYSLSNDGLNFETALNGITHTFDTTGNRRCWRATLNSSVNITSPIVRKLRYDITPTSIENISVDLDNDGIIDQQYIGNLSDTGGPFNVNLTPTAGSLHDIKISAATAGLLQIDNFRLNSTVSPVILDESEFEFCSNCTIDFEFSGDAITVNDLKWDFFGSHNYTATARFDSFSTNRIIQVYYSDFNVSLPDGILFYDVFVDSPNSKNVTPFGQTEDVPVWSITNLGYDEPSSVYAKTNATINACLNITFTNSSHRTETVINESFVWINGTELKLENSNLVTGSDVVFNQSDGEIIGNPNNNNYTIDSIAGTITLISNYQDRQLFGINYSIFVYHYDLNQDFTFRLNESYQQLLLNITTPGILNFTQTNETTNVSLTGDNSTQLNHTIIPDSDIVVNATAPFASLNRDVDYKIDYSTSNFTLFNETFNITNLFVTYNYTEFKNNTKGNWVWEDYNSCTARFFDDIYFFYSSICTDCVFQDAYLDATNIIIE